MRFFLGLITTILTIDYSHGGQSNYCVPTTINFNSAEEFKDGKTTAYLILFTMPLISLSSKRIGIIEKYHFSPDGRHLTAQVRQLTWNSGSNLTSKDVVNSITESLPKRPIGKSIKISNYKILDQHHFEMDFDGDNKNLTADLITAFGTNARHNRIWVSKKHKNYFEFISKYKFNYKKNNYVFKVKNSEVALLNKSNPLCNDPDITIFSEFIKPEKFNEYEKIQNNRPLSIILQINSDHNLATKNKIYEFIRIAFKESNDPTITISNQFFEKGEPGFTNEVARKETNINIRKLNELELKIAVELPIMEILLKAAAKKYGVKLILYQLPIKNSGINLDAQLLATSLRNSLHVFIQDSLNWPFVSKLMKNNKRTLHSIKTLSKNSSFSFPTNNDQYLDFNKSTFHELALLPIARIRTILFSKKNLDVMLNFEETGELELINK